MPEFDCRDEVFRERGHEVLGSMVQATQMAFPDPFDVEDLHVDAREAFNATLDNVRSGTLSRILLISGEAGCGKTHLIRALRAQAHRRRRAVIAYVHMTSEHGDYLKYLLRQVVRSLSDPYLHVPHQAEQSSALDLISDALAKSPGLDPAAVENLSGAEDAALAERVGEYADALSEIRDEHGRLRYADVDLNILRIFLYRQSNRKPIQRRVGSFLNGEPMGASDWQKLAALPQDCDRGPMYLLGQLARITAAALGCPLVICVDQIEASDVAGQKSHDPFIRAMSTACELIENVPRLMVLLSCLDSAYSFHAPQLIASYRHRIENEPSPVTLIAGRSAGEIREIVSRRLKGLYERVGLEHVPSSSIYPLPEDLPEQLARQHLRSVLQQINNYWQTCHRAEEILPWKQDKPDDQAVPPLEDVDRLRLKWGDFRTAGEHNVAENEAAQLDLLAWALGEVPNELADRASIQITTLPTTGGTPPAISFILTRTGDEPLRRLVGLCEKDPRGNGLYNQVSSLESQKQSPEQSVVIVRSTRFPRTGMIAGHLLKLQQSGGVCQMIEEPCWHTMQALREFLASGAAGMPGEVVQQWRRSDMPLAGLPEIGAIVQRRPPVNAAVTASAIAPGTPPALKQAAAPRPPEPPPPARIVPSPPPLLWPIPPNPAATAAPSSAPSLPEPPSRAVTPWESTDPEFFPLPPMADGPMLIGTSDGFTQAEVKLDPQLLTRHTAIFGANGSGKTVLALTIVEMLLERGVNAVLFDRKGDLATYAVSDAWEQNTGAPDEKIRRRALRDRMDLHLYTPGCPTGRPLVLPLLPDGLGKLSEEDRREQCRQAAMILCHVCAPSNAKADMFATVLSKAIELLCTADLPHTLDNLEHLLLQSPQELLRVLPAHGPKHCEEVGRRLNERRVAHGRLFSDQGEKLNLRRMLGNDSPGRVRLSIICTQFLDGDSSLAWIAQFLAAAGKFIQQFPSPEGRLQALLMFDEADLYIPTTSKPVCKPGMENLLRRARGAGVGVMLASQNVGDFDYKALDNITTAFAGKLTTKTATDKLRSRFGDIAEKLPRKTRGQFVMGVESDVREIRTHMCLVRPTPVPREQIERLAAAQAQSARQDR